MSVVAENFQKILSQIPQDKLDKIKIVAVSKLQPIVKIQEYIEICQHKNLKIILGENYLQEAKEKITQLPKYKVNCQWHMLGPLQSNKVKQAVEYFDLIQSVHSLKIAQEINRRAAQINKIQEIFLQINISNDQAKSGINQQEFVEVLSTVNQMQNVKLRGLMTITQIYENPEDARGDFRALAQLRDQFLSKDHELSMGMSNDFLVAIEEGATMIRVGTAIFGEREAS